MKNSIFPMTKCEKFVRSIYPDVDIVTFHDQRGVDGLQWMGVLNPNDGDGQIFRSLRGEKDIWIKLRNKINHLMLEKLAQ
jgi:hypothetical protein